MKRRRFLSFFLALILSLCLVPTAAAIGDEKPVLPEDPDIRAKAALLVDAATGSVVYAKNEHEQLYPASLTKIMTALLVFDAIDRGDLAMDQELTVTETALYDHAGDGSFTPFKPGEIITVRDLLYCLLVVSSNEASGILAEAVSGSSAAFVTAMNERAAALGCQNTNFVNDTGLHDAKHVTSAWDLYLITRAAMDYPEFITICDVQNHEIAPTNLCAKPRVFWTTNHLLSNWRVIGYRYTPAHGIKDGSTTEAGLCLVSSARKHGMEYISVILGAERETIDGKNTLMSFAETPRLFDYGFDHFTYKTILEDVEKIQEVPVSLSKTDYVTVHPAKSLEVLMPKVLDADDLERTIHLEEQVEAPVRRGQKLGSMELSYEGTVYATVDLLASVDVEADRTMVFLRDAKAFFAKTSVRIIGIVLAVLILVLVVWKLLFSRRRYRYGRSVGRGRSSSYRGRRRH